MTSYDGGLGSFARSAVICASGAPARAWRVFSELPEGWREPPWELRDIGALAAIVVCAVAGAYFISGAREDVRGGSVDWRSAGMLALGAISLAAVIYGLRRVRSRAPRISWIDAGFGRPLDGWRSSAARMIAGYAALFIWVWACSRLFGLLGMEIGGRPELPEGAAFAIWAAAMIVAAPLGEELVFRGVLLGALLRAMPAAVAALISAALFAAIHMSAGGFVIYFGAGVYFAALYMRSGSLWPGIMAHAAHNAISVAYLTFTR